MAILKPSTALLLLFTLLDASIAALSVPVPHGSPLRHNANKHRRAKYHNGEKLISTGRYSPVLAATKPFSEPLSADPQTNVDIGFDLLQVADQAVKLSKHSWEYGTATQMLLEVYEPDSSVYGMNKSADAFPSGHVPVVAQKDSPSLDYATKHIMLDGLASQANALIHGDGSAGDPASLTVAAVMLGATDNTYAQAATKQVNHLLTNVPRWSNGAISHREDVAAVWADAVMMIPPAIAYQGAATNDSSLLRTAVQQIGLYRDVLQIKTGPITGAWRHIRGQAQSLGAWTTGNAWAALGMTRVLATIANFAPSSGSDFSTEIQQLTSYVYEIFNAVEASMSSTTQQSGFDSSNGLLRGYLLGGEKSVLDTSSLWPGDTTGTAGIASAMYRMAVLDPSGGQKYLGTADALRKAVSGMTDPKTGLAGPAMNPLAWWDPKPVYNSPEGQALIAMMGASFRDCYAIGPCAPSAASTPTPASA